MAKVVRVYGKADSFDIELSRNGDIWEVEIPPDMTDGVYAVELTAIDENGEPTYWVGELFMCSGVCCLKWERKYTGGFLSMEDYSMKTSLLHGLEIKGQSYTGTFSENFSLSFDVRKSRYDVRFSASGNIDFSISADATFSANGLHIEVDDKKMLLHRNCDLSIGKECTHVL